MSQLPTPKWLQLRSHPKDVSVDLECPFPVGVEYYRPPVPPTEFWDDDFHRIRQAGMQIVRTFCPWNWVETEPNRFEFDDLDLMFELAAKHDLRVWLDTPVPSLSRVIRCALSPPWATISWESNRTTVD